MQYINTYVAKYVIIYKAYKMWVPVSFYWKMNSGQVLLTNVYNKIIVWGLMGYWDYE